MINSFRIVERMKRFQGKGNICTKRGSVKGNVERVLNNIKEIRNLSIYLSINYLPILYVFYIF